VEVAAIVVACGLRVAEETSRGRWKLVRGAIQETGLDQPPENVAIANPAWDPRAATTGEEDLASSLVQLVGQLTSGLAAADDQDFPGGSVSGLR